MSSADAGFPPGITAGALGRRLVAYLIDALPPAILLGLASGVTVGLDRTDLLVPVTAVAAVVSIGWWLLTWWWQGSRGASLGQKLLSLELVAIENGRSVGFGRAALRGVIFLALAGSSVGLIVMLVLLLLDGRRQGWHDRAARAVVITARPGAGARPQVASARPASSGGPVGPVGAPPAAAPVGLPPSLSGRSPYAPDQGTPGADHRPPGTPGSAPGYGPPPGQGPHDPAAGPGPRPIGEPPFGPPPGGGRPFHQPTPGGPGFPGSAGSAPMLDQVPDFAAEPPEEMESTRLVPRGGGAARRPDQGWLVVLGDGRQVAVETLVLLGRNPQPRAGEEGAELIKVTDSSRTVSKTHIAIGVDQRGAYVMDRGSTNGSAIATTSGAFEPCAPGQVVRVRENQIVSFGEQRFEVRRSYS